MVSELVLVAVVLVSALIAAAAQYLFKSSMPRFDASPSGLISLVHSRGVVLGLLLYAASLVVYLYALSVGELSFVYPTFASVFVFVLLISRFKLGERITLHRAAGVALVVIGIAVIALTY